MVRNNCALQRGREGGGGRREERVEGEGGRETDLKKLSAGRTHLRSNHIVGLRIH